MSGAITAAADRADGDATESGAAVRRQTVDEAIVGVQTTAERREAEPDPYPEEIIDAELEVRRRAEAVAGPGPRVRTDGGDPSDAAEDLEPLHVGDHVSPVDREATTVVMRVCDQSAGEYWVDEIDETVAEYHGVADDEDVYQVAFAGRDDGDLADLMRYPYPRSALELEEPIHDRDDENGGDQ